MENTMNNRNEIPQQVKQVVSIAETLLQGQILGMYLYGSATMNKLRPDSDIDILIITRQELNLSTKKELTKQLLEISGFVGCAEKRPLEITVIHQKDIIPWQFPPKCEYMYGEWLRKEMEAGMIPQACFDPDIAILLWQARKSSMTLKGADCKQLILPIPFREIQKAIQFSLPGLISNVKGDERNVFMHKVKNFNFIKSAIVGSEKRKGNRSDTFLLVGIYELLQSCFKIFHFAGVFPMEFCREIQYPLWSIF